MKALILPLLAAAVAACATTPPAAEDPTARLGEIATVDGLHIRPLQVVEDSRCPINARCVWAGRIVVLAEVRGGAGRARYSFTLGEPIVHGGRRLALVAAEPGRVAGSDTDPATYVFTFEMQPR
jgi:hypothetical protein